MILRACTHYFRWGLNITFHWAEYLELSTGGSWPKPEKFVLNSVSSYLTLVSPFAVSRRRHPKVLYGCLPYDTESHGSSAPDTVTREMAKLTILQWHAPFYSQVFYLLRPRQVRPAIVVRQLHIFYEDEARKQQWYHDVCASIHALSSAYISEPLLASLDNHAVFVKIIAIWQFLSIVSGIAAAWNKMQKLSPTMPIKGIF